MYARANIDWIRKKASAILERESLEVWGRETPGSGEAL
jgi:hypothetical protein